MKKGSKGKEHLSSNWPHHPAHPFSDLCRIISSSLYHFILPLPAWDWAPSASALSPLPAGKTFPLYLFP